MRIAYSCAGEGFGHVARMVALYPDLSANHQMNLFVPQEVQDFVRARLQTVPLHTIPCFKLAKRGNRIDYLTTARWNIKLAYHFISIIRRLAHRLGELKIDVVLSDFDPLLPFAARWAGIPIVQMNHPGIVLDYIDLNPQSWLAALLARFLEGPRDKRIIVSFYGGDVGPVLRKSLYRHRIRDEGFLTVNLKPEVRAKVLPILEAIPGLHYKLYPAPDADFDEGLTACSAVITGAGHQTLSEALCLGKPILAIPQEGQFEQLLNARMLAQSGRGSYCTPAELTRELPSFLSKIAEYRKTRILPKHFHVRDSRDRLLSRLNWCFNSLCVNSIGLQNNSEATSRTAL